MAKYKTEIHWGGESGSWHSDADLEIQIINRKKVVPSNGAPKTGTSVTWSSSEGNGDITFYDNGNTFNGNAQFPGEGPVGYRGELI